jgi:hypothetical protein
MAPSSSSFNFSLRLRKRIDGSSTDTFEGALNVGPTGIGHSMDGYYLGNVR